jgi:membrane protein
MLTPKQLLQCLYRGAANTINHDGIEHAGYLAFLGLLALFPFLVFVVAVVGFIGQGESGAGFITWLLQNVPQHVTAALQPRILEIVSGPPQGLLTFSILGTIWTASSAVEGLRTVLNRAYHVATPPAYWFRRSLSIFQFLFFTSILIAGMLLIVFVPLLLVHVETFLRIHIAENVVYLLSTQAYLLTMGVLFLAVCYIYYIIPNIKQRFVSVAPGAFLVVVGWAAGVWLFTEYLSNFEQVNLVYGSLGGIIAALVFFYICNVIFIFGAEFNYQIVHTLGLRVTQREEVASGSNLAE